MFTDIKIAYPNLWLHDTDFDRAIDLIINSFPDRSHYMVRHGIGFSKFVDGDWKPILVPNPVEEEAEQNPYITTSHPSLVQLYLETNPDQEQNITFFQLLFSQDVKEIGQFSSLYSSRLSAYRKAFWSDQVEDLPIQTIVISSEKCPEEISFCFKKIEDVYPNTAEFYSIISHINESCTHEFVNESEYPNIAKAAIGLKESDFIHYCLTSLAENSTVTAKYINDKKMSDIKSNGILEIINPKITFDDIGGLDVIKDVIKRTAILRSRPELIESYGITPIRRMLMVGVPGTGKSAICQATSAELGLDLARTGISQVMNKYIGQSESNMRAVFQQIKIMNPLCVWIDEFGRDLSGSGQGADSGTTDRVHGEFLTGLQELPNESFLLCAANELHSLKPEMLRADRFDKIFFVGLPSHSERVHIFKIHLSSIQDQDFDYDALAECTAFMTGAEIVSLIKETKFYVVSEYSRSITTNDITSRAPSIKNTIWRKHPDTVKSMYEYAIQQWDWASTEQLEDANVILGNKPSTTVKQKVSFN